jgi:hypothetical protein
MTEAGPISTADVQKGLTGGTFKPADDPGFLTGKELAPGSRDPEIGIMDLAIV